MHTCPKQIHILILIENLRLKKNAKWQKSGGPGVFLHEVIHVTGLHFWFPVGNSRLHRNFRRSEGYDKNLQVKSGNKLLTP